MKAENICILNFRNINEKHIDFSNKTFIHGLNGSGKTSVLEALYTSLNIKSFKTSNIQETINNSKNNNFVKTAFSDDIGFLHTISLGLDRDGNKKIILDEEEADRKKILNLSSIVSFIPEDINIIIGSPKNRRDFFDRIAFIDDRKYFDCVYNYNKYLKHKTVLLKTHNYNAIKFLNIASLPYILEIRKKRSSIADKITKEFNMLTNLLSLNFQIDISVPHEVNTEFKLQDKLTKEIEKGYPLYGPHIDNISFKINSINAKSISWGELTFLTILLKIAELSIYNKKNINPIFVADDVLAFLDERKESIVLNLLNKINNQVIITSSQKHIAQNFDIIELY